MTEIVHLYTCICNWAHKSFHKLHQFEVEQRRWRIPPSTQACQR